MSSVLVSCIWNACFTDFGLFLGRFGPNIMGSPLEIQRHFHQAPPSRWANECIWIELQTGLRMNIDNHLEWASVFVELYLECLFHGFGLFGPIWAGSNGGPRWKIQRHLYQYRLSRWNVIECIWQNPDRDWEHSTIT
jgi:hypothetical protein